MQTAEQQTRALASWDSPVERDDDSIAWNIAEERRERDWSDLEATVRDFVKVYGPAAMLRCISDVLK